MLKERNKTYNSVQKRANRLLNKRNIDVRWRSRSFQPITGRKDDFGALAPYGVHPSKKCSGQTLTILVQAIIWQSCGESISSIEVAGVHEKSEFAAVHVRKSHLEGPSPQTVPATKSAQYKL